MKKTNFLRDNIIALVFIIVNFCLLALGIEVKDLSIGLMLVFNILLFLMYLIAKRKEWKNIIFGSLSLTLVFVLQFLAGIIGMIYIMILSITAYDVLTNNYYYIALNMINIFIIVFYFGFILSYSVGIFSHVKERFKIKSINTFILAIAKFMLYYMLMWVTIIFVSMISSIFFSDFVSSGVTSENQIAVESMIANLNVFISFVVIVIIGPIFEELLFRHMLMKRVLKPFNKYAAALISTFIFMFIHLSMQNFTSIGEMLYLFSSYFALSFILSFIYAKEENLLYTIGIHILNNGLAFVLILIEITLN